MAEVNFFQEQVFEGLAFSSFTTNMVISESNTIYLPQKSCFEKFKKITSKATTIDAKINEIKPTALGIFSFVSHHVERIRNWIPTVKSFSEYIGILNYLDSSNKVISGDVFLTKDGSGEIIKERRLKVSSSILKVLSKTVSYLSIIPALLTANPAVLTATSVAKFASRVGMGTSLAFSATNKGLEMYEAPKKRVWTNYVAMVGLAAISYTVIGTIIFSSAAVANAMSLVGHVTMGSLLINDMISVIFFKKTRV